MTTAPTKTTTTKSTTTTTTTSTTTTTTTTTTTRNPDHCPSMPVNWRGSKYSKSKKQLKSYQSQQIQITILKKNKENNPDQNLNIRKQPYIGYLALDFNYYQKIDGERRT